MIMICRFKILTCFFIYCFFGGVNGKLGSTAVLMFHVKQFEMAAKTTIGIIIFILSMSLFLTLYKIVKSEDEKIKPWYLFCSLLLSTGAGTAAFVLFEN